MCMCCSSLLLQHTFAVILRALLPVVWHSSLISNGREMLPVVRCASTTKSYYNPGFSRFHTSDETTSFEQIESSLCSIHTKKNTFSNNKLPFWGCGWLPVTQIKPKNQVLCLKLRSGNIIVLRIFQSEPILQRMQRISNHFGRKPFGPPLWHFWLRQKAHH